MHLATFFRASVLTALLVYLLIVGEMLLIPFVMAFFFWYLIKILATVFQQIHIGKGHLGEVPATVISVTTIFALTLFLIWILHTSINQIIDSASTYTENFARAMNRLLEALPFKKAPDIDPIMDNFDLAATLSDMAVALASFLGSAGLTLAYLFFIFVEERFFKKKLHALFPDEQHYLHVIHLLNRIDCDVRTYIGLKTLCSFLTAILSLGIMAIVGLDFALLWALLIFLLNYIPNIGSMVATALPSLLALIQFPTLQPFTFIAGGIIAVQMGVSNLIEPRLMGRSLNLSPLVIVLSLVLWGVIWGLAGMFICVPITVILMIILAQFETTRPISILLSRDGQIRDRLGPGDGGRLLSEAAEIAEKC